MQFDDVYSAFEDSFASLVMNNKQGFIKRTKEIILQPKFNCGEDFNKALALVEINAYFCWKGE